MGTAELFQRGYTQSSANDAEHQISRSWTIEYMLLISIRQRRTNGSDHNVAIAPSVTVPDIERTWNHSRQEKTSATYYTSTQNAQVRPTVNPAYEYIRAESIPPIVLELKELIHPPAVVALPLRASL